MPIRRSSAPEKLLAGGLAVATCVGLVGLIGVRLTAEKSATEQTESAVSSVAEVVPAVEEVSDDPVVSKDGLTREQLDAYAITLAAEKHRLDVYRVELIRVAKELRAAAGSDDVSAEDEAADVSR